MKKLFNAKAFYFAISLFGFAVIGNAQVTTATLSGIVKDAKGTIVPSATVTVEYADAGIRHTLVTKADGRFTVPNLRVGGPYVVTVEHVSFDKAVSEQIFLELD